MFFMMAAVYLVGAVTLTVGSPGEQFQLAFCNPAYLTFVFLIAGFGLNAYYPKRFKGEPLLVSHQRASESDTDAFSSPGLTPTAMQTQHSGRSSCVNTTKRWRPGVPSTQSRSGASCILRERLRRTKRGEMMMMHYIELHPFAFASLKHSKRKCLVKYCSNVSKPPPIRTISKSFKITSLMFFVPNL